MRFTGFALTSVVLFLTAREAAGQPVPPVPPIPPVPAARARDRDRDRDDDLERRRLREHAVSVRRGYLGVEPVDLTPELRVHFGAPRESGVLIGRVAPDTPAARANLAVGDVITAIDGRPVTSARELKQRIRDKRDGDKLQVEIVRNRNRYGVSVAVVQRETSEVEMGDVLEQAKHAAAAGQDARAVARSLEDYRRAMEELRQHERNGNDRLQSRIRELDERLRRLEQQLNERNR